MKIIVAIITLFILFGITTVVNRKESIVLNQYWNSLTKNRVDSEVKRGKVALVTFAPHWCPLCHIHDIFVLRDATLAKLSNKYGVALFRAKRHEEFFREMHAYPSATLMIYSKKNPNGKLLSSFITPSNLDNEINKEIRAIDILEKQDIDELQIGSLDGNGSDLAIDTILSKI